MRRAVSAPESCAAEATWLYFLKALRTRIWAQATKIIGRMKNGLKRNENISSSPQYAKGFYWDAKGTL